METFPCPQKVLNLLNNFDNLQNLQQRNGMSFMIKIQIMVKEIKIVHLRQKLSNHVFAIIQIKILPIVLHYITATNGNQNANVKFKNCDPFTKCITHINDEHMDEAKNLDITMSLYKLIEYSGSLKMTNHLYLMYLYLNPDNVATDNHHHHLNTNQVFSENQLLMEY